MPAPDRTLSTVIADVVDKYDADLVDLRRDLHTQPELSWSELRTCLLYTSDAADD